MFYTLQLNAKLQPYDRHDLEDLIEEFLSEGNLGATSGGGTMMDKNGEVEYCDIELELNSPEAVKELLHKLEEIGIPKGSKLYGEDFSQEVGTAEGLAIYINGTDLPEEVYQNCDINEVYKNIEEYFYINGSFAEAKEKIKNFVESYPLCEKCRIVQIA